MLVIDNALTIESEYETDKIFTDNTMLHPTYYSMLTPIGLFFTMAKNRIRAFLQLNHMIFLFRLKNGDI